MLRPVRATRSHKALAILAWKSRLPLHASDFSGHILRPKITGKVRQSSNKNNYHEKEISLSCEMNKEQDLTAEEIVNTYSQDELAKIFFEYGEEKFAPSIARNIVKSRMVKPIETTFELVDVIKSSLPAAVLRKQGHPAKQVFQALRIEVNHELDYLKVALKDALSILNVNGALSVITFHSLEDRIVKNIFKEHVTLNLPKGLPFVPEGYEINYELINKNVVLPSDKELDENNRSHSAKLRGIRKIK